jgi:tripartite-type tricarboxylate transporter receptor subunit TctC
MTNDLGGISMVHVPYRGVAPLANDLLGNTIDFGVFVLSSGLPHIKSGRVVALGVTEAKRSAAAPDIAPLSDNSKLKGLDIGVWFALMGPAKLPEPIVAKLKKALNESLQSPELRKKLEDSGSTIAAPNVDINTFLKGEVSKYQKIVDFAKIKE